MKEATREFLRNPPPGSKTRAALDFGIDFTLTANRPKDLLVLPELESMLELRLIEEQPDAPC
ncbi:MAG: hypothetical protein M3169_02330 [Candidatus Eremiobacteraeota bacterium]|nr:hypothetical protein [Candidatus Eremiobacteraeota bacterium]